MSKEKLIFNFETFLGESRSIFRVEVNVRLSSRVYFPRIIQQMHPPWRYMLNRIDEKFIY